MSTQRKEWVQKQDVIKKQMQESGFFDSLKLAFNELPGKGMFMSIKQRWGRGDNFYNLFWWNIRVDSKFFKEEYKKYSDILLLPHRISLPELAKSGVIEKVEDGLWLVENERFKKTTCYPHIDITTGNFHVKMDFDEWINNPRIEQIVLVTSEGNNHLGPRYEYAKGDRKLTFEGFAPSDFIVFQGKGITSGKSISKISIPKKCYYPGLEEVEIRNETIQDMIKNLLINIVENREYYEN